MANKETISRVPTNIITGFLGVGKTTAIRKLLTNKPREERWAVLVNEFGEVGIDSNLFKENTDSQDGITISQVPGGCMCCTNGLPIQMALSLLLAKSKPHRLLIEPTGLGHPKEVLTMLSRDYYREVLDVRATLSLVDARKLQDTRYTNNDTFNQQLEVAEVIIANKSDLYEPDDFPALLDYVEKKFSTDTKLIYQVQHGALDIDWLAASASDKNLVSPKENTSKELPSTLPPNLEAPLDGFISAENSGEGFFSKGWIFNADMLFKIDKLLSLVHGVEAERLKGVFVTNQGFIALNKVDSMVTQLNLNELNDSRIEVISGRIDTLEGIEEELLTCLA